MRILALIPESNKRSPARIYRGDGTLERLRGTYIFKKSVPEHFPARWDVEVDYLEPKHYEMDWAQQMRLARDYDWLFVMRSAEPQHVAIASKLHAFGLKIWYDLDDDYTGIEPDNTAFNSFQRPDVQESFRWFMQNANIRTYSTKSLLDKFGNGHLCPNALDDSTFDLNRPYPAPNKGLITWRGGGSHVKDLIYFKPQLAQMITDNPETMFQFIGLSAQFDETIGLLPKNQNVRILEYIPDYWYYMTHLLSIKPWGNIVPLRECAFNRAKSNIAALESVYAGACPIVPNWEEWNEMPAVLKYDNPQEFSERVNDLLNMEPVEHKQRWEANMDWIRKNRSLSVVNSKRIDILRQYNGKA